MRLRRFLAIHVDLRQISLHVFELLVQLLDLGDCLYLTAAHVGFDDAVELLLPQCVALG